MGWKPETGFLPYYWDTYSEQMLLYALAIGSRTHPIPPRCWRAWSRDKDSYAGYEVVYCPTGSLFVYLQSHAWIDFRGLYDGGVNYWANSVNAVYANKAFCSDNSEEFKTYSSDNWGLTASLGPWGYKGYGAKPGWPIHDGTVAPFAVAASLPFSEKESLSSLRRIYDEYSDKVYGKYGFIDAFNTDADWWSEEYLGIDQGLMVLMIENYRTGLIWRYFMRLEPIRIWIDLCLDKGT
jgi:hypothetical protein